jgi:pantoate--beta-alanine ligase
MIVVEQVDGVRQAVREARGRPVSVGCVPTMGALHAGHTSLFQAARRECGLVVATIFVNPAQFGPGEDFSQYPRPREDDLRVCRQSGVDLVFAPEAATVYPPGYSTFVDVESLSRILEGQFRPGHFRGVATVVLKLLNAVRPDAAYFGRKDYQQQLLIRKMCRDLDLPVEIRTCPTVRDPDGLALSSRNRFLSADERRQALRISQALQLAGQKLAAGETDVGAVCAAMRNHLEAAPGVDVDYAVVADPDTLESLSRPQRQMIGLVAARVGGTRLIDNLPITIEARP